MQITSQLTLKLLLLFETNSVSSNLLEKLQRCVDAVGMENWHWTNKLLSVSFCKMFSMYFVIFPGQWPLGLFVPSRVSIPGNWGMQYLWKFQFKSSKLCLLDLNWNFHKVLLILFVLNIHDGHGKLAAFHIRFQAYHPHRWCQFPPGPCFSWHLIRPADSQLWWILDDCRQLPCHH